tara:strand:- start:199 stop:1134 length:936 start_codon:yes stop_codon:yes gene_type:complete
MEIWREKYRPATLDDMVGCHRFLDDAKKWTESDVPAALLFVGPAGTGKTSASGALAKDMLGDYFDPTNYYVTNASDDRGIDFVRELKHIAKQGGIGCNRKFILLDEADNLTGPAQKALRQIMETTSECSIFILTANDLSSIHSAIRDRCLIYEFKPHTDADSEELFRYIHEQEGLPDDWLESYGSLNRLCGGSLRSAIDLLQGTSKKSDSLDKTLRSKSEHLSKASLLLVAGQFDSLAQHLRMEMEKGTNRIGMLRGLRYRAKHLFDDADEYYSFMLTYGEFVEKAMQWADDDAAFVDYFVARLKNEKERK